MSNAIYLYDVSHAIIDNIQFMMGMTNKNLDRFYAQDLVSELLANKLIENKSRALSQTFFSNVAGSIWLFASIFLLLGVLKFV